LTVYQNKDVEGQYTQHLAKIENDSQRWELTYLDKMNKTRTSGMNKNRNLEINKPFYIISDMLFDRVITVGPSKNLILQSRT